ncbi:autotransporter outer membrane beta-barrel domain-containing protein [Helicobacter kayseriensis]|uniref:autotransporter outer membrane beta-barrel domain-containing protein n=1 Tax=Helicobacter kayseriensis TaxID=2905877 RepID=UPI001E5520CE|nr:autotransporter outer membrane beta-barrel domain-containing protein [Helicobacter kayseriensis]MCE3047589.1 hypothetical protein [Helicobacter kayseriensis]MCE3048960.1 hypothetical protein [Helicobacter kayseriensis]
MKKYISLALSTILTQALAVDCTTETTEIKQGETCTISLNQKLEISGAKLNNQGTLVFENYSSLSFKAMPLIGGSISSNSITGESQRGKILINGYSTKINAENSNLSILNQDINFSSGKGLTIIANTLTLGDTGKETVLSSQSSAELILSVSSTEFKNAKIQNLKITSDKLTTLTANQLTLDNVSLTSTQDLSLNSLQANSATVPASQTSQATLTLTKESYIKGKKFTISGDYKVSGGGNVTFGGESVEVGKATADTSVLSQSVQSVTSFIGSNSQEEEGKKTSIGFYGTNDGAGVLFHQVSAEDVTLQVIKDGDGAVLGNVSTTLKDAILEGRDSRGQSQVLVIENGNSTKTNQGVIKVQASSTNAERATEHQSTLSGAGIGIYGHKIEIGKDTSSQNKTGAPYILNLTTDDNAGEIALGKENSQNQANAIDVQQEGNKDGEVSIEGKNGSNLKNGAKHTLKLGGNKLIFDGSVMLKNLSIQTQSKNDFLVIEGKTSKSILNLESIDLSVGMLDAKGEGKYQGLFFTSQESDQRSILKATTDTSMKASEFVFKNQNLELTQNKTLNLYAYGAVDLPKDSQQAIPESIGRFAFYDTTFASSSAQGAESREDASSSTTLKLYSGENGAKILSSGWVLKDMNLESLKIQNGAKNGEKNGETKASLDLSDRASNLTALGKVTLSAADFRYQQGGEIVQGVGMDLFVGDSTAVGNLVLKSDQKSQTQSDEASEKFIIGGTLTLDHSSINMNNKSRKTGGQSTFDIEIGSKKLSEFKIGLIVEGGISALHANTAGQSTEIKAETFDFQASSKVHSKNGILKLTSKNGLIEIKGTTILEGTETAKASIEANKQNGAMGVDATTPMLALHDVEVRGSAELKNNFAFKNSNILAQGDGTNKTFTIQKGNGTKTGETIDGVDTLTLQSAVIDVKNSSNGAELQLNSGGKITSSGESELKTAGLSIASQALQEGGTQSSLIALEVLDGTLKITETTAKDKIGTISLGHKNASDTYEGGNLILLKNGEQKQEAYNALKIQAPLTSYGDSSITASSFSVEVSSQDPVISSVGGELKLIAKGTSAEVGMSAIAGEQNTPLKITSGEIKLVNGSLGFYTSKEKTADLTLGQITLGNIQAQGTLSSDSATKITSIGNSTIKTSQNGLQLHHTEIASTGGTLQLVGLKGESTFGNIVLNNGGLIALAGGDSKDTQESIKLGSGKTITMISSSPYVSPSAPLGGGGFGQIQAKSVSFEGNSTESQKLINLVIKPEKLASGVELFSLREGDLVLIKTSEGITKNTTTTLVEASNSQNGIKIDLTDISLDYGGYKSLQLTPKLEEDESKSKVLSLLLGVSVVQNNISELLESVQDPTKRKELEATLAQGRLEEIADSILTSSNHPLKVGIAENIAQGNTQIVSEVLYYADDGFDALAHLASTTYNIYEQMSSLSFGSLQNRMARIKNPYAPQEELATLLREASKYAYASDDDGIILDVAEEKRLDKGGIWASYDGAMRSGRSVSSSVNGLSAGYDGVIDDHVLLGGFVSYLYGGYNGEHIQNSSHNIHLGLYSRMYFGGHEIDLVLSQMIGINSSTLNVGYGTFPAMFNGEFGFNWYATSFQARYGYAFALGEEESPYYLKPVFGIDTAFILNDQTQTNATASIGITKRENVRFDLIAGLELRKYFNAESYVFVLPMVQAGIINLGNQIQVGFVGSRALAYDFDQKQDINVGIYAGGQGSVAQNLAISGGMGIKMGVKNTDVITSWNVGLKYKF